MRQSLTVRRAEHFDINRKIIANMTAQSWHDIPHVVVTNEPEASEFLKVFKEINEGRAKEDKITLNAVILKVITEALKKCPAMNAHIDFKPRLVRGCVTEFDEINISMPMLLDSGEMMTVNLHNMQDKNLRDIRDTLADVQRRAKNSNMSQVMYDVSLNDTLQGLAKGKLVQTISRLIGSKTGKYKVKTLSGMYHATGFTNYRFGLTGKEVCWDFSPLNILHCLQGYDPHAYLKFLCFFCIGILIFFRFVFRAPKLLPRLFARLFCFSAGYIAVVELYNLLFTAAGAVFLDISNWFLYLTGAWSAIAILTLLLVASKKFRPAPLPSTPSL